MSLGAPWRGRALVASPRSRAKRAMAGRRRRDGEHFSVFSALPSRAAVEQGNKRRLTLGMLWSISMRSILEVAEEADHGYR